jgi:hypothetical protein
MRLTTASAPVVGTAETPARGLIVVLLGILPL